MSYLNEDQIQSLQSISESNNGHCDRCGRVIKIYRYKINAGQAKTLRAIADRIKETGEKIVNLNDLDITYSAHTQQTKMRLHGLIAKYKVDGVHVASMWVITKKGWRFLGGEDIESTVVVFDNQVLGHTGGFTNIKRLTGEDIIYEEESITTPEAEVYKDIRKPSKNPKFFAQFKGKTVPRFDSETVYEIEVESLRIGKPIKLVQPFQASYKDVAEFYKYWKIIKEIK